MADDQPVALALGGGAAKGLAHVGVLCGLEEDGVEITALAGTSMGAVIGALWAQGMRAREMEGLFRSIDWGRLGRILVTSVTGAAFRGMVRETFGGQRIDDLPVPFAAVCGDLDTGDMVVLDSGEVATAVCASSSIPGILPPTVVDGRRLIDGAVVEPVPVTAAKNLVPGRVLAVNVMRPPIRGERGGALVTIRPVGVELPSLFRRIEGWLRRQRDRGEDREIGARVSRWEAVVQAFHIMQYRLAASYPVDTPTIEPPTGRFGWFDFHRADEIIDVGYESYRRWAGRPE